jgi:hypothetical protein
MICLHPVWSRRSCDRLYGGNVKVSFIHSLQKKKMQLHYTFLVLSIVLSIINQLDIYTSKTAESDSHLHTCKLTQTTGVIVSQLKVNRSRLRNLACHNLGIPMTHCLHPCIWIRLSVRVDNQYGQPLQQNYLNHPDMTVKTSQIKSRDP